MCIVKQDAKLEKIMGLGWVLLMNLLMLASRPEVPCYPSESKQVTWNP